MSDPPRLKDLADGVPDDVRRLLSNAQRVRPMTARERDDLARKAVWLAVTPAAVLTFGQAIAAAALVGAIVVGAVVALHPRAAGSHAATRPSAARVGAPLTPPVSPPAPPDPQQPPVTSPVRRRAARSTPPPAPSTGPVEVPRPSAASLPVPAGSAPPAALHAQPPTDESLAAESALLLRARSLLERDPAAALAVLATHDATFPRPHLADERDFMTVEALRRLGRSQEAQERAEGLIRRSPNSPYARLLRRQRAAPTP